MTHPSKITIEYQLTQAQNLMQFRNPQTVLRIIGKHYWYKPSKGPILADWITDKTDVAWLKTAIEKGEIYLKED